MTLKDACRYELQMEVIANGVVDDHVEIGYGTSQELIQFVPPISLSLERVNHHLVGRVGVERQRRRLVFSLESGTKNLYVRGPEGQMRLEMCRVTGGLEAAEFRRYAVKFRIRQRRKS